MKRLTLVKHENKGVRRGKGMRRKNYRRTIYLKCRECGKFFEVPEYEKGYRKFCTRTCGSRYFNSRRKKHTLVTKNCLYCGDEFTYKSFPNRKQQRFCSTDCCNRYHRHKVKEENRNKLYKKLEEE